MSIYLELIWAFFQIGLFSIGGGYAALPLIQAQVVDARGWLTMAEFADVITISQMTPGPIAINAATFVGMRLAGIAGAIAATIGNVIPSCIIVLALAKLYKKYGELEMVKGVLAGLRPAVVALIAVAGISIMQFAFVRSGITSIAFDMNEIARSVDWIAVGLFAVAFVVLRRWKPDPIIVMLGCGAAGLAFYMIAGA